MFLQLVHRIQLAQSWNFYVHSPNYKDFAFCKTGCQGTRLGLNDANVYVMSCSFESCTSGTGGAIYQSSGWTLVVENCVFVQCSATSSSGNGGGAIFKQNGQFIIIKSCASKCESAIWGPFFISIMDNVNQKNEIHECNIEASSTTTAGAATMNPDYGTIIIKAVNVSYNTCTSYSAIDIQPSTDSNANMIVGMLSYSNVVGNEATSSRCIQTQLGPSVLITRTNIIGNIQPMETDVGLIQASVRTDIIE